MKRNFDKKEEQKLLVPLFAFVLAVYAVVHDLLDMAIVPRDIIVPIFFLTAFAICDWVRTGLPAVKRTLAEKRLSGWELAKCVGIFLLAIIMVFWHDLLNLI
ncbi:MAG: hypothetical protein K6F52_04480 [Clostridia bacterium]|nr:hypothetical protein [Clostridia bacterium]